MKRIAIVLAVVAMFASTATIALADDGDVDTDADVKTDSSEPEDFNEAETQKLDALAGFLIADPSASEGADEEAAKVEILDLRYGDYSTGWGAIFKLLQLSKAKGMQLDDLLTEIAQDGGGWAFGRRFKEITDPEDPADGASKNFGQLKKQDKAEKSNNGKNPTKP
jgi:hypothetical protein